MTLQEWLNERRESQNTFVRWWLSQDEKDFPMECCEGDWDEQFDTFVDERGRDNV